jgi:hypothetical protein
LFTPALDNDNDYVQSNQDEMGPDEMGPEEMGPDEKSRFPPYL